MKVRDRVHFQASPPFDYEEAIKQIATLVVHVWAVLHHAYRLSLVLRRKPLPPGL